MKRSPFILFLINLVGEASGIFEDVTENRTARAGGVYDKLFTEITQGYNYRIRPFFGVKPVNVEVFMYVSSLRSVSEQTMDYKLELYYREYWQDDRLEYNPRLYGNLTKLSLHESLISKLWMPDTFLPNAINSENPDATSISHRSLLRLESSGHLLFSRRLSVTAECPMDLSLYPFDQQVCRLSIESYGLSTMDIVYGWRGKSPVTLNANLELPDLKIQTVITAARNITLGTGTYSRLECCFVFKRDASFYFIQSFIPGTAIVITSWTSLWLERESPFSDMIAVILAITFLYYSYSSVMPKVSYVKAMDVFLGTCFLYVFLSLIMCAILKFVKEWLDHDACKRLGSPQWVSRRSTMESGNKFASPRGKRTSFVTRHRKSENPLDSPTAVINGNVVHLGSSGLSHSESQSPRIHAALESFRRNCRKVTMILFPMSFIFFCGFFFVFYIGIRPDKALNGHNAEEIVYHWRKKSPVIVSPELELPTMLVHTIETYEHNVSLKTGNYSRLECCFVLRRSASFFFVQQLIPGTAIVVTSWMALWMERESTFHDMIEVILSITFLYNSYNTLKVSYVKAMDIYLGTCFMFVVASLFKLAILKAIKECYGDYENYKEKRLRSLDLTKDFPQYEQSSDHENELSSAYPDLIDISPTRKRRSTLTATAKRKTTSIKMAIKKFIDMKSFLMRVLRFSRRTTAVLFPICFFGFCLLFCVKFVWKPHETKGKFCAFEKFWKEA